MIDFCYKRGAISELTKYLTKIISCYLALNNNGNQALTSHTITMTPLELQEQI